MTRTQFWALWWMMALIVNLQPPVNSWFSALSVIVAMYWFFHAWLEGQSEEPEEPQHRTAEQPWGPGSSADEGMPPIVERESTPLG